MTTTAEQAWRLFRKGFKLRRHSIDVAMFPLIEDCPTDYGKADPECPDYFRRVAENQIAFTKIYAEKYVQACCDAWDISEKPRSGAFYRAVFIHCLVPLFGEKSDAVLRRIQHTQLVYIDLHDGRDALKRYTIDLATLKKDWQYKLETLAEDCDARERAGRASTQVGGPCPSLSDAGRISRGLAGNQSATATDPSKPNDLHPPVVAGRNRPGPLQDS